MEKDSTTRASAAAPPAAGLDRAVQAIAWLLVALCIAYEIAVLAYAPKSRPLQFYGTIVVPYVPLLIVWTLLTLTTIAMAVKHRSVSALLSKSTFVRKHWANALLGAISIVVGLMFVEASLRIANPLGISALKTALWFWEELLVPDANLRYRLSKDATVELDGVMFETNSDGMRDDERLGKSPGRRILVLGDSVALGTQVDVERTAMHLLEDEMGGRHAVDVVNTAVSSYNTVQQYRLLAQVGDEFSPDLVLLLYVENDIGMDHELPYYGGRYWRQAVFLPRRIFQYSYTRTVVRLGMSALFGESPSPEFTETERHGVSVSMDALYRIKEWCAQRKIPFVVAFYSMLDETQWDKYLRPVAATGKRFGFPVLDTRKYWGNRPLSEIYNTPIDAHLNEMGHALLAEQLAQDLRSLYPNRFADDQRLTDSSAAAMSR